MTHKKPNLNLIQNYENKYRVFSLNEIIELNEMDFPKHCAVWRGHYFHHFIVMNVSKEITVIHKVNKDWKLLAVSMISILERDFLTTIVKEEILYLNDNSLSSDTKKLFDFQNGFYILGNYSHFQKNEAIHRAYSLVGKKEIYSFVSNNCEHFANWCFTSIPFSYQADILFFEGETADAGLEVGKSIYSNVSTNLTKVTVDLATKVFFKNGSGIINLASTSLKSGLIGVAIQTPVEAIQLTRTCLKMEEKVKQNKMKQCDMDREVTKKVFGSVGSIGGGLGIGTAGMAIGTLICPVIGTTIGGVIGSFVGSAGGKFVGSLTGSGLYKVGKSIKDALN